MGNKSCIKPWISQSMDKYSQIIYWTAYFFNKLKLIEPLISVKRNGLHIKQSHGFLKWFHYLYFVYLFWFQKIYIKCIFD